MQIARGQEKFAVPEMDSVKKLERRRIDEMADGRNGALAKR